MTRFNDQAVQVAQRWYGTHSQPSFASRQRMIDACAVHLSDTFAMSMRGATNIAVAVWGDLQPASSGWGIDLDRTTRSVLVLEHRGGGATTIAVDELHAALAQLPPRSIGIDTAHDPPVAG